MPRLIVDNPCAAGFAAYPYADGRGNLRWDARQGGCEAPQMAPVASRRWAAQTELEGAYAGVAAAPRA